MACTFTGKGFHGPRLILRLYLRRPGYALLPGPKDETSWADSRDTKGGQLRVIKEATFQGTPGEASTVSSIKGRAAFQVPWRTRPGGVIPLWSWGKDLICRSCCVCWGVGGSGRTRTGK